MIDTIFTVASDLVCRGISTLPYKSRFEKPKKSQKMGIWGGYHPTSPFLDIFREVLGLY
jgi:hypothetical protein